MEKKKSLLSKIGAYFRIFKGVKMPWLLIIISVVISAFEGLSQIEVATLTGNIIDGTQNSINTTQFINYVTATAVMAISAIASNYFSRKMEETLTLRIRVKLWRKIMRLPTAYYDKDNGNELVTRVTSDASAPASLIVTFVVAITSVVTVVRAFLKLYETNTMLANYSLIMVPVIFVLFTVYSVLMFKLGVYSTKVTASSLGYLSERVRNFRLIKSAVTENMESLKGNKTFKKMYFAEFLSWLGTAVFQIISSVSSIVFIIIVFVIGGTLVPKGILTVGDLTGFYMITGAVGIQLGLFFINGSSLFTTLGTMKKISVVLDTPDEVENGSSVQQNSADIVLENVTFAYNSERNVINNFSATIPAGKITAVVGGNGAGKSTLFKLLTRLYEPKQGKINYGENNIATYNLTEWRNKFAYVIQKEPLLSGTVRENLTYGLNRKVTDEELVEVTKKANCYDCIISKPNGFDEDVGLGGSNFSGGQAQCISIARAMLRGSDIMLLDEATSNLDVISEAAVTEAMNNLMKNKTTVMIAHNYAATRNADHIIVMNTGVAEAEGTPNELLKTNSFYKAFANTL